MNLSHLVHRTAGDSELLPPGRLLLQPSSDAPNNQQLSHATPSKADVMSASSPEVFINEQRNVSHLSPCPSPKIPSFSNSVWLPSSNKSIFHHSNVYDDNLTSSSPFRTILSEPIFTSTVNRGALFTPEHTPSSTISSHPTLNAFKEPSTQLVTNPMNPSSSSLGRYLFPPFHENPSSTSTLTAKSSSSTENNANEESNSSELDTISAILGTNNKMTIKRPPLTITGDTVTSANIEEGYIQFVLHHDPQYIGEGIESLMYVKRKFSSVPKTGDLSYSTWDVFVQVKKLHNQEIKNWSQLVGQLGLSDMAGRPQFAQRVKRWMHKYKIDCYFDYLLGNEFNFHSADEKYTGCLMMGNYQKRRLDRSRAADEAESVHPPEDSETHNKRRRVVDRRRRRSLSTEEVQSIVDDEDDNTFSDTATSRTHEFEKHRGPIVFAGSRKRLREVDPSNLRFMDNVRRVQHSAKDESEHPMDDDMEESDAVANSDEEQQMEAESTSGSVQLANSPSASPGENQDDEEDELASSSVGSPDGSIMSDFHSAEDELNLDNPVETEDDSSIEHPPLHSETTAVDSSFAQPSLFHNQTSTNEAAAGPSVSEPSFSLDLDSSSESKDSTTLCANCHQVPMMKKEIQQLKDHIALLEKKLQEQQKAASTKETDLSQQLQERNEMCEKYERWRKDMAKLFLQEPSLTSSPPKNNLDVDTS